MHQNCQKNTWFEHRLQKWHSKFFFATHNFERVLQFGQFFSAFFRWRVAIAMELQLLQTLAWKLQKHTVLPHSQIVRVNNRVNRQIFANLSSSKGGSLTAASTSTTPSRVLHIPSFFYEYVVCGAATGNGIISAVSPSNDLRTKNRSHLSKLLLEYCVCVLYSLLFFLSHFHSFSCELRGITCSRW